MDWMDNHAYRQELQELCNRNIPYEKLKGQKILVSGATGLIGSYLTDVLLVMDETLNLGMRVTAYARSKERAQKRFASWMDKGSFEIRTGDICDFDAGTEDFDYIIHGAGNAHPKAFAAQPVETMCANLIGTMKLLDYAKNRKTGKLKKFVLLSTGEIYGTAPMPDENGWREECAGTVDSMQVRACYPESKRAAETLCRAYADEYDVSAVVARLGYVFGATIHEDNSRADTQFLRKAAAGEDIVMKSAGLQERSYCYLFDAAEAIILIMLKGQTGEAYNVAVKGNRITIYDFAQEMARTFGVDVRMQRADEREQAGYSKMTKEILNPEKLYDLGFCPKYTISEAMCQMREMIRS